MKIDATTEKIARAAFEDGMRRGQGGIRDFDSFLATLEAETPAPVQPDSPIELAMCEVAHLVLKPNQPYIFRVMKDCKACIDAASPPQQTAPIQPGELAASQSLTKQAVSLVRSVIERTGIKQTKIADKMGVTRGAVSQFLDGSNITTDTIQRIGEVLGVQFYLSEVLTGLSTTETPGELAMRIAEEVEYNFIVTEKTPSVPSCPSTESIASIIAPHLAATTQADLVGKIQALSKSLRTGVAIIRNECGHRPETIRMRNNRWCDELLSEAGIEEFETGTPPARDEP